jgi:hypothetical protein
VTTVATHLALHLHQPQNTLRQRLREFYKDAAHKAGNRRREAVAVRADGVAVAQHAGEGRGACGAFMVGVGGGDGVGGERGE